MASADDITITFTHTQARVQPRNIYNHTYRKFAWTKQNSLILNPDKTTCTLFTPDPAEYTSTTHGEDSGSYPRPKTHIHPQHLSTSTQATTNDKNTHCNRMGKPKETLTATYKAVMRPALEYASSIWSPLASSTSINICMMKHSHFLYTSTYSSTPHNPNRKHNIHHIPYSDTQHTSTLQGKKKNYF